MRLPRPVGWAVFLVALGLVVSVESYGLFAPLPALESSAVALTYTKAGGLCAGRTFEVVPEVSAPPMIPAPQGTSPSAWIPFAIGVTANTSGQACDPLGNFVGLRHTNVTVRVRDATQPFNASESWFESLDVLFILGTASCNFGLYQCSAEWHSHLDTSGELTLGSWDAEWNAGRVQALNVTFVAMVGGSAILHVGDRLVFTVTFSFVIADSACFGACWSPFFDEGWTHVETFAASVVAAPG